MQRRMPRGRASVCRPKRNGNSPLGAGLSGKLYPWGDEFMPDSKWMANTHQGHFPDKDEGQDGRIGIGPVAQLPPNAYGLHDVAGNVWEWVSDWYRPDYYQQLASTGDVARNPPGPGTPFDPSEPTEKKRVHRGGSFLCTDQYCSRYMVGTRGKGETSYRHESRRIPTRQNAMTVCSIGTQPVMPAVYGVKAPL